jgi:hypothetical protein
LLLVASYKETKRRTPCAHDLMVSIILLDLSWLQLFSASEL